MIKHVKIENFFNLKQFEAPQLAGINLLIGDNDTGKTALLKLLYAISKTWEIYSRKHFYETPSFQKILGEKLLGTFQPGKNQLGELVTKSIKDKLKVSVTYSKGKVDQNIGFKFGGATQDTLNDGTDSVAVMGDDYNVIFIPAKEVLTAFRAIKFTREPHHLTGFDDTYLDLIKSLEIPTQAPDKLGPLNEINQQLEEILGGKIHQTDDNFFFKRGHQEFSMPMTAESFKKIGTLTTLIQNHQLNTGTILFLDEPESALHPKAIRRLVKILVRLASAGVQVFLSTHDFFIAQQLSICARRENSSICCFSLLENHQGDIEAHCVDLKNSTPSSLIVDELLKMSDEDVALDFIN